MNLRQWKRHTFPILAGTLSAVLLPWGSAIAQDRPLRDLSDWELRVEPQVENELRIPRSNIPDAIDLNEAQKERIESREETASRTRQDIRRWYDDSADDESQGTTVPVWRF